MPSLAAGSACLLGFLLVFLLFLRILTRAGAAAPPLFSSNGLMPVSVIVRPGLASERHFNRGWASGI